MQHNFQLKPYDTYERTTSKMKFYQEILLSIDDPSNPFKLPDGLIKNIFQYISGNFTPIIIFCSVAIIIFFYLLIRNRFSNTSSYWIIWIAVFTVLAAFCLSVSFEDLGFTIFKTIVPTVAGLTALALLIQNDQKNRREASDRFNEYIKSLHIDRRNRHFSASQKISEGGDLNTVNGLHQLAPLPEEWSQDNFALHQKDIEAQNIASEISEVFNRHAKFKNNHPSPIEFTVFRIMSDLRGQHNLSRIQKFMWNRIENQIEPIKYHGNSSCYAKRLGMRWTRKATDFLFYIGKTSIFNSIKKNDYTFYIENSEINTHIDLPGFNGLEIKNSNFHNSLEIRPRNERVLDAYIVNVDFSGSTFNAPVNFYLTKFLHTSNLSPFIETIFEGPVKFSSCVFVDGIGGIKFKNTQFKSTDKSLVIENSFFYPSIFIEKSKITDGSFTNTRFSKDITIKQTSFKNLYFGSCDMKSISIELIKSSNPNDIPRICIDRSIVNKECVIKGNEASPEVNIDGSFFSKKTTLGENSHHPLHSIKTSKSTYTDLEIYASNSISIENCKVNSINLVACEDGIFEIEINDLKRGDFTCNETFKQISIYGSGKTIKKLIIKDIDTEEIILRDIHFPKNLDIKLTNIKTSNISIDSNCSFANPGIKDKIDLISKKCAKEYQQKIKMMNTLLIP